MRARKGQIRTPAHTGRAVWDLTLPPNEVVIGCSMSSRPPTGPHESGRARAPRQAQNDPPEPGSDQEPRATSSASPPAIQLLPDHLVDQIAAGEVVERPASVVKELTENALDAGATHITVEVQQGGKQLIRVHDNGSGMTEAQARLALQRHATSKLRDLDDLYALTTMGFRGEALPSIASVSHMTLTTRVHGQVAGTRFIIEAGRITSVSEIGAPVGTHIEIQKLLHNVPARLKFLKGNATEASHVTDIVNKLAMAHPHVHVRLKHGNRTAIDAPMHTSRLERVRALLGNRMGRRIHRATGAENGVHVDVYLSAPDLAQTTTRGVQLYVGRRPVKDRGLLHAIQMGYGELVPKGRYPVVVLFVDLERGDVDVNVHPQKLEVRFSDAQAVYAAVRHTIRHGVADAPWLADEPEPGMAPVRMRAIAASRPPTGGADDRALPGKRRPTGLAAEHAAQTTRMLLFDTVSDKRPSGEFRAASFPLAQRAPDHRAAPPAPSPTRQPDERSSDRRSDDDQPSPWPYSGPGTRSGLIGRGPGGSSRASEPRPPADENGPGMSSDEDVATRRDSAVSTLSGDSDTHTQSAAHTAEHTTPPLEPLEQAPLLATDIPITGPADGHADEQTARRADGQTANRADGQTAVQPTAHLDPRTAQPDYEPDTADFFSRLHYIGQLDRTYLLCETAGELILVDQHAAHERVAFQRLRERYRQRAIPVQRMLFPLRVELDIAQAAVADDTGDDLSRIGFELSQVVSSGDIEPGLHSYDVQAIPAGLPPGEAHSVLLELLAELAEHGGSRALEERLDLALATIACHSVVRAGDVLSTTEVNALFQSMDGVDFKAHCPHGRPVLLRISIGEIARRFGRS